MSEEEHIDPDTAITAFMGWLTSRDEVAGPFSGRHEAGSAVELMKQFFAAQGWEAAPDERFKRQIKLLKSRYPKGEDKTLERITREVQQTMGDKPSAQIIAEMLSRYNIEES